MEMTTKKYSAKEILSNKTNMTAWLFGNVLHKVLKEQYKDVTLTPSVMESDFIKAVYKGKSWKKDYGQHLRMSIKSPVFIIDVNALTEKTIDLFSIVVKDEFKKQYGQKFSYKFDFPIVLAVINEDLQVFISAKELNRLESTKTLIDLMEERGKEIES